MLLEVFLTLEETNATVGDQIELYMYHFQKFVKEAKRYSANFFSCYLYLTKSLTRGIYYYTLI